jgi:hypothetical protein
MQLNCIHCGHPFTITTEQLGGKGRCPHCDQEVRLPSAGDGRETERTVVEPSHWWENSISGLVSGVVHMLLLLFLALYSSFGAGSGEGLTTDVLIGELASEVLGPGQDDQLSTEAPSATQSTTSTVEESLEVGPPIQVSTTTDAAAEEQLALTSPSTGGGSTSSFDLGAVSIGGGSMGGGSFEGLVQNLRRNGLDIVLTFDSTGSMGGEIRAVERQIHNIGSALLKLVPKARIGLVTYRDEGDEYVVRGLPLTNDITAIDRFLAEVEADGGGDEAEAVHKGLEWAIKNNQFRQGARKVILLFGDAPPHPQDLGTCLTLASDFQRTQKGIVSTVTCRHGTPLREFYDIARAASGEAFLSADQRQIMTQLMVLVFGGAHRDKVVEAFKLMER